MPRRPKYPSEVKVTIPKEITVLYETPILEILLTKNEAEMAERIINHIKTNGRLWPDEWKVIIPTKSSRDIQLYYRTLKKLVSLGLIGRGKEGSFILSGELSRKLTVMIEKVNALTGGV